MSEFVEDVLRRAWAGDTRVFTSAQLLTGLSDKDLMHLYGVSMTTVQRWRRGEGAAQYVVRSLALLAGYFPFGLPKTSRWAHWAGFRLGHDGCLYPRGSACRPGDGAAPRDIVGLPFLRRGFERAYWRLRELESQGSLTGADTPARVLKLNGG